MLDKFKYYILQWLKSHYEEFIMLALSFSGILEHLALICWSSSLVAWMACNFCANSSTSNASICELNMNIDYKKVINRI